MDASVDLAVGGGLAGLVLANRCAEQGLARATLPQRVVRRGLGI
jgi:flavin-dependent dehydrogenase